MKSLSLKLVTITVEAAFICVLFACPAVADPPRFSIKDILPPEFRMGGGAGFEINNAGQVGGFFFVEPGFLYDDRDGSFVEIPIFEFTVTDINESGVVAGYSAAGEVSAHIYENGVLTDISRFEGTLAPAFARGLNDAGEVTGSVDLSPEGGGFQAFLYFEGTMRLLDLSVDQGSCNHSDAHDINNAGQIVGRVRVPTDSGCMLRAFLHEDGKTLLIGDLLPDEHTEATRINESGQAIVNVRTSLRRAGAYLYSDGDLRKVGDDSTAARGLNNSGWVVGEVGPLSAESHAFLYIDGEFYDLNDLVPDLTGWDHLAIAHDINDSGQITGQGIKPEGHSGAFLLTPLAANVKVDVGPGNEKNKINLRSKGNIAVAILSTRNFDATQVDWETVTFGPREATERHQRIHLRDVGKDGDMDAVLHFKIRKTGIRCHDKQVTLTGETFDGQAFTGTDAIRVVKCRG